RYLWGRGAASELILGRWSGRERVADAAGSRQPRPGKRCRRFLLHSRHDVVWNAASSLDAGSRPCLPQQRMELTPPEILERVQPHVTHRLTPALEQARRVVAIDAAAE